MDLVITFEDGSDVTFDLADPNSGIIQPKLPKSNTQKWTQKQMQEYASQIARMGFFEQLADERIRFYSPEHICYVDVPQVLDLN